MKKNGLICMLACMLGLMACNSKEKAVSLVDLTQYVDPFIGTGGHGHVFLGANFPFGAVQVGPVNLSQGWDWCSGYHISDSTICGFSHLHLSGTGIGDLGDVALMPVIGDVPWRKGNPSDEATGFFSYFSHDNETALPGYYQVLLDRFSINVELTATNRVGFHKYTFPTSDSSRIIVDLKNAIGWDRLRKAEVVQESDSSLSGCRWSSGWAKDQRVFFYAVFSQPMTDFVKSDSFPMAYASFQTKAEEPVMVKVAISPVSVENAKANMQAELSGWDFEAVVKAADQAWNEELNKVVIDADNETKRKFYTSLYHTMIAPSTFNDVNGDYWGPDTLVHNNPNGNTYTTYSLWDTYRAAHPLMTIIHPEKVGDIINTMLQIYQQQGKLPMWHLVGSETNTMVGKPGMIVVADALMKGFKGFDHDLAYEALKATAMDPDRKGSKFTNDIRFIPADSVYESVASGLEYAIADWSLGQVAKKLGKTDDYNYFDKRGKAYHFYFDPSVEFARGRVSDTEWRTPFNPFESIHEGNDFTEGNAWQYTWLVPQDVEGLVKLFGSEEHFIEKLDSLFVVHGDLGDHASPDISGLIGQYAHGNEPSHHILYMYAYVGQQWKTAEKVRQVLSQLYRADYDGLCGNEDVGQMSAWYILSSMGFYPVNPVNGCFVFGSPAVNEATINIPGGKQFKIEAKDNSSENIYIQSVTLNGQPYTKSYFTFKDITAGGTLVMQMGSKPSETFGVNKEDRPYSE